MTGVSHAAGVSPSQALPKAILSVDMYGTALVLEEFGNIVARGGTGVVIASQSGHCLGALTNEQNKLRATSPADQLLSLPMLQLDQVKDSLHAYLTGAKEKGVIYGTGAWTKGDIKGSKAMTEAYDMGKKI